MREPCTERDERRVDMPLIFIHGVNVREAGFAEQTAKVRTAVRKFRTESELSYADYFWGGSAAALRWGGASIPDMPEDRIQQLKAIKEAQIELPDLRRLLLIDPMIELTAFRAAAKPGGLDLTGGATQDRNRRLRLCAKTIAEKLTPGDSGVLQTVVDCMEAATQVDIALQDLVPIISRSLTATLFYREIRASEASLFDASWTKIYDRIHAVVKDELGTQLAPPKFLINPLLNLATFGLRHGLRANVMPMITQFLADAFVYLGERDKFLNGLNAVVIEAKAKKPDEPLMLISHSLGGIITFDYCCVHPEIKVDLLATVASQVGYFAECDSLAVPNGDLKPDSKRSTPANVKEWISVYDRNDVLSFMAAPIFDRVTESETKTKLPFPDSHGSYWDDIDVYRKFFV